MNPVNGTGHISIIFTDNYDIRCVPGRAGCKSTGLEAKPPDEPHEDISRIKPPVDSGHLYDILGRIRSYLPVNYGNGNNQLLCNQVGNLFDNPHHCLGEFFCERYGKIDWFERP